MVNSFSTFGQDCSTHAFFSRMRWPGLADGFVQHSGVTHGASAMTHTLAFFCGRGLEPGCASPTFVLFVRYYSFAIRYSFALGRPPLPPPYSLFVCYPQGGLMACGLPLSSFVIRYSFAFHEALITRLWTAPFFIRYSLFVAWEAPFAPSLFAIRLLSTRRLDGLWTAPFFIRYSLFVRFPRGLDHALVDCPLLHSSFVIRYSSFVIRYAEAWSCRRLCLNTVGSRMEPMQRQTLHFLRLWPRAELLCSAFVQSTSFWGFVP